MTEPKINLSFIPTTQTFETNESQKPSSTDSTQETNKVEGFTEKAISKLQQSTLNKELPKISSADLKAVNALTGKTLRKLSEIKDTFEQRPLGKEQSLCFDSMTEALSAQELTEESLSNLIEKIESLFKEAQLSVIDENGSETQANDTLLILKHAVVGELKERGPLLIAINQAQSGADIARCQEKLQAMDSDDPLLPQLTEKLTQKALAHLKLRRNETDTKDFFTDVALSHIARYSIKNNINCDSLFNKFSEIITFNNTLLVKAKESSLKKGDEATVEALIDKICGAPTLYEANAYVDIFCSVSYPDSIENALELKKMLAGEHAPEAEILHSLALSRAVIKSKLVDQNTRLSAPHYLSMAPIKIDFALIKSRLGEKAMDDIRYELANVLRLQISALHDGLLDFELGLSNSDTAQLISKRDEAIRELMNTWQSIVKKDTQPEPLAVKSMLSEKDFQTFELTLAAQASRFTAGLLGLKDADQAQVQLKTSVSNTSRIARSVDKGYLFSNDPAYLASRALDNRLFALTGFLDPNERLMGSNRVDQEIAKLWTDAGWSITEKTLLGQLNSNVGNLAGVNNEIRNSLGKKSKYFSQYVRQLPELQTLLHDFATLRSVNTQYEENRSRLQTLWKDVDSALFSSGKKDRHDVCDCVLMICDLHRKINSTRNNLRFLPDKERALDNIKAMNDQLEQALVSLKGLNDKSMRRNGKGDKIPTLAQVLALKDRATAVLYFQDGHAKADIKKMHSQSKELQKIDERMAKLVRTGEKLLGKERVAQLRNTVEAATLSVLKDQFETGESTVNLRHNDIRNAIINQLRAWRIPGTDNGLVGVLFEQVLTELSQPSGLLSPPALERMSRREITSDIAKKAEKAAGKKEVKEANRSRDARLKEMGFDALFKGALASTGQTVSFDLKRGFSTSATKSTLPYPISTPLPLSVTLGLIGNVGLLIERTENGGYNVAMSEGLLKQLGVSVSLKASPKIPFVPAEVTAVSVSVNASVDKSDSEGMFLHFDRPEDCENLIRSMFTSGSDLRKNNPQAVVAHIEKADCIRFISNHSIKPSLGASLTLGSFCAKRPDGFSASVSLASVGGGISKTWSSKHQVNAQGTIDTIAKTGLKVSVNVGFGNVNAGYALPYEDYGVSQKVFSLYGNGNSVTNTVDHSTSVHKSFDGRLLGKTSVTTSMQLEENSVRTLLASLGLSDADISAIEDNPALYPELYDMVKNAGPSTTVTLTRTIKPEKLLEYRQIQSQMHILERDFETNRDSKNQMNRLAEKAADLLNDVNNYGTPKLAFKGTRHTGRIYGIGRPILAFTSVGMRTDSMTTTFNLFPDEEKPKNIKNSDVGNRVHPNSQPEPENGSVPKQPADARGPGVSEPRLQDSPEELSERVMSANPTLEDIKAYVRISVESLQFKNEVSEEVDRQLQSMDLRDFVSKSPDGRSDKLESMIRFAKKTVLKEKLYERLLTMVEQRNGHLPQGFAEHAKTIVRGYEDGRALMFINTKVNNEQDGDFESLTNEFYQDCLAGFNEVFSRDIVSVEAPASSGTLIKNPTAEQIKDVTVTLGQGRNCCFIDSVANALIMTDLGRTCLRGKLNEIQSLDLAPVEGFSLFETYMMTRYKESHNEFEFGNQGLPSPIAADFHLKEGWVLAVTENDSVFTKRGVFTRIADTLRNQKGIVLMHEGEDGAGHYTAVVGARIDDEGKMYLQLRDSQYDRAEREIELKTNAKLNFSEYLFENP